MGAHRTPICLWPTQPMRAAMRVPVNRCGIHPRGESNDVRALGDDSLAIAHATQETGLRA